MLHSKTLWVNAIAMIALLLQSKLGFVLDAEAQAAALTLINLVLRFFTSKPLKKPANPINMTGPMGFALIILASIFLLSACAGGKAQKTTDTLLVMQSTVVSLAEAADDMCTRGDLTQAECDKVADIYSKAKVSYDLRSEEHTSELQSH